MTLDLQQKEKLYLKKQLKKIVQIDNSCPVYANLPMNIEVGLYHSWAIEISSLPECLKITGISNDSCLMSFQHKQKNIYGIQFHPESFMTKDGLQILKNFLNIEV